MIRFRVTLMLGEASHGNGEGSCRNTVVVVVAAVAVGVAHDEEIALGVFHGNHAWARPKHFDPTRCH